jgi:DNA replication and repair protein RecF
VGGNGAGKTNVVDAIHYLSMGKSSLSMTDGQSVRHGEEFFVLSGDYVADGGMDATVSCGFKKGHAKTLKFCGKEYERLSDHIGIIPLVMVSPADGALVSDSADERRRWLNAFVSQLDHPYLDNVIRYNRLLAERNTLLKQGEFLVPELLDVMDDQLDTVGRKIAATRSEVLDRLAPLVERYYAHISADHEPVELRYRTELHKGDYLDLLHEARQKDICMGFTTIGVHRDDVVMTIGGYPLRKFGSQGQQKSFLLALKLAQYTLLQERLGERPLLLLDDLFDKLDMRRVAQLLRLVGGDMFGQIFITDCNKHRLQSTLGDAGVEYKLFNINDGKSTQ